MFIIYGFTFLSIAWLMLLIAILFSSESRLLILDLGTLSVRTEKPALRSSAAPGGEGEPPHVSWQLTFAQPLMLYVFS